MNARRNLPVYVAILYVIFCWALNTVLAKQAVAKMDPLAFTFVRFLIMTPLAFAFVRLSGERVRIERRDLGALLLCGTCGYGLYQYLWILGLARTSAFTSSLFSAMTPIFTLGIVAIAGHERVRSGRWFGVALALFGIAVYEGAFAGSVGVRSGDVLTLFSAMSFAGFNVVSSRLLNRYSPLMLLAIAMSIGTVMIAPGGIPAMLHTDFTRIGADVWWRLLFATLFPILLTYPVWSWAIGKLGAGRVSIFSFLTPILAGLMSIPILGTRFTPYQLTGAAICLLGMLLSSLLGRVSLTNALRTART